MKQFYHPVKRSTRESIVPMINVVFLLLIFFMMTAQLRPSVPFEIAPPVSLTEQSAPGNATLFVSVDGELAFAEARGAEEVFRVLASWPDTQVLKVSVDKDLEAITLSRIVAQLGQINVTRIALVTRLQGAAFEKQATTQSESRFGNDTLR